MYSQAEQRAATKYSLVRGRRYDYAHAYLLSDILPKEKDYSFLTSATGNVKNRYKTTSKHMLASRIFCAFLNATIEACIEGDAYRFPSFQAALMRVESYPGQTLLRKKQQGRYKPVSLIESDGYIYGLVVQLYHKNKFQPYRRYQVRVGMRHYNQITERVNAGFAYLQFYYNYDLNSTK